MKLFVALTVILSVVFVAVSQIIRNFRRKNSGGRRTWVSAAVMLSAAVVVMSDAVVSETSMSLYVLSMEIMPSVMAMWLLSSFMAEGGIAKWGIRSSLSVNVLMTAFNVCRMAGLVLPLDDAQGVALASSMTAVMILVFACGLADWMRQVKAIMRCGTIWAVVGLSVDIVYALFGVAGTALVQLKCPEAGVLLLGGIVSAIGVRIMTDARFLLWQRQETIIVESMKLTSVASASDAAHIEEVYKELYHRVVSYFETKKPFLDSDLTINDVVRDVYSNKLYISRAISRYTGRNFCQFVNYYRVRHSMECFRENCEMKVSELAGLSGFNSVVSYNMAFRLFMGENPSEWCRRERSRLMKKK